MPAPRLGGVAAESRWWCAGEQDIRREVAIMKKLEHPNVVRLVEVIDDPSYRKIYLVQELVAGGPVHRSGAEPLAQERARQLFRGMLSGLEYLHAQHIVHRDIKPENVLVTGDGTAKITDFGVSRTLASDSEMLDEAKGTPGPSGGARPVPLPLPASRWPQPSWRPSSCREPPRTTATRWTCTRWGRRCTAWSWGDRRLWRGRRLRWRSG